MTAHTETKGITIKEMVIDSETVLFLGETTLVRSKSLEGAWYEVRDGRCTCAGFQHRGKCRHTGPAMLAAELDRTSAQPAEPEPAPPAPAAACQPVMPHYLRSVMPAYSWGMGA